MKKVCEDFDLYSIKNFHKPQLFQKQKLIDICWENRQFKYPNPLSYSWPILHDNLNWFPILYQKFTNYCKFKFNYNIDHSKNRPICYCYASTEKSFVEQWHNHLHTSTITSVYYLSITKKGTSIDFRNNDGTIITYYPKEYELIMFPNHLDHKPNRGCGKGDRISINMELTTKESSIEIFHKLNNA